MSTQTMKVIAGLDIGNGYVKGKALVADASRDIIAAKNAGTVKALRLDMSTQTMKVIAGLDIGNGYVKGKALVADASRDIIAAKNAGTVKALRLDCPSIVSYTTGSNLPVTPTPGYMSDLLNQLDVTITSNAVKAIDDSKRMFVGTRAVIPSVCSSAPVPLSSHIRISCSISTPIGPNVRRAYRHSLLRHRLRRRLSNSTISTTWQRSNVPGWIIQVATSRRLLMRPTMTTNCVFCHMGALMSSVCWVSPS